VKGEAADEQEGAEAESKGGKGAAKKDPRAGKTLEYKDPTEFKESRTFKNKADEYFEGHWRRPAPSLFVTLDTVMPEMPKTLVPKPDEAQFKKKQGELIDRVREINKLLDQRKEEFEDTLAKKHATSQDGKRAQGVQTGESKKLHVQIRELRERRNKQTAKLDAIKLEEQELRRAKDACNEGIDRTFNTLELIPRGLKEAERQFTSTGNFKSERDYLRRVQYLKDSAEKIREREGVEARLKQVRERAAQAKVGLPELRQEIAVLKKQIDEVEKTKDEQLKTFDEYNKILDAVNAKRKKESEEREKLLKQKDELRDGYYGQLIAHLKQQRLIKDINWVNEVQGNLRKRKEEEERRQREHQERQERIQREREERRKQEEERKEREALKREREAELARQAQEQLRQAEIDQLALLQRAIDEKAVGASPLFDQIEQCESLKAYCLKQIKRLSQPEEEAEVEAEAQQTAGPGAAGGELAKQLEKGALQLAPSKSEKEQSSQFEQLKSKKGKKAKKRTGAEGQKDGATDFVLIRRFNSLKLTPPLDDEGLEGAVRDLDELRAALVYWGGIILRQNKIRFIKASKRLGGEEEFTKQAEEEEAFIAAEKQKFDDDDAEQKTKLSLQKLKIAQVLDREARMSKAWEQEDDDEDEEPEEEGRAQRGGRGQRRAPQAKLPSKQKFKDIMKNEEAFPTLGNQEVEVNQNKSPEQEVEQS